MLKYKLFTKRSVYAKEKNYIMFIVRIFANNNFVLYGYMKYHYLVLAKMGNTYFLGVPGKYNPNVKMLAEQFGFENFYPVEENRGYWCVPILYPKGKEN